jgi:hypothetical protein
MFICPRSSQYLAQKERFGERDLGEGEKPGGDGDPTEGDLHPYVKGS